MPSLARPFGRSVNSLGNKILPFVIYEVDRVVPKRERLQDQNELSTFSEVVSPHLDASSNLARQQGLRRIKYWKGFPTVTAHACVTRL
jgi:hypothetical protein